VSTASDGRGNSSSDAWRRALEMTAPIAGNASVTFPKIIETLSDKFASVDGAVPTDEELRISIYNMRSIDLIFYIYRFIPDSTSTDRNSS